MQYVERAWTNAYLMLGTALVAYSGGMIPLGLIARKRGLGS